MNTEVLLEQPETTADIVKSQIHKNLPWILGAATVVIGSLMIRTLIRRAGKHSHEETEQSEHTSAGITTKSIAFQLLPLATLFLKNWLKKTGTEKEVATA